MNESDKKHSPLAKIKRFFDRDIWETREGSLKGPKGASIGFLRILITTVSGIVNKRILVQASSLSYATLLAIGPILAITIIFSGMFFREKGEHFIYDKIMSAATFAMPAFNEMATTGGKEAKLNPQVLEFIDNVSQGSAKAGAAGIFAMLLTCLLLCINMESAFNFIWGVKKGRAWVNRIVFYFAMIFLGSVGSTFGMTFFTASSLAKFVEDLPFVSNYASWIAYALGLCVMAGVLASFYKFIPYARVRWKPAVIAAAIILFMLVLNNKMSFVYISYIVKQQNFYGYLAIVAVAMFSLYVFWAMILIGGQISYAVQYVDLLSDDDAWAKMGARARKLCALAVFAEIEKSFYSAHRGSPTIEHLVQRVKMPKSAVAPSVSLLAEKGFICAVDPSGDGDDVYYKPEVSPEGFTLGEFLRKVSENSSDSDIMNHLASHDSLVESALSAYAQLEASGEGAKNLKELLK